MFNDRKHMPLFGFLCVYIFLIFHGYYYFQSLIKSNISLDISLGFFFIEIASARLF